MDAKMLLSIEDTAMVDVSPLTGAPEGSVEVEVTRPTLERLIQPLVQRARARVEKVRLTHTFNSYRENGC
jgi:molecular chaperone DnaK (HSP70)